MAKTHSHDLGYKELFSHPDLVKELMLGFVPQEISQLLDYTTLEMQPSSYITPLFKEKIEDCVWSIKLLPQPNKKPQEVYLFLLLEFQSSDDKTMPLRMLHYTASFYHQIIKEKKLNLNKDKLPLVFPLVLYNGDNKWKTPTSFIKLLPTLPKFLKPYQPQLNYYLIDEKQLNLQELEANPLALSGVFNIEQAEDDESLTQALTLLSQKLASYPNEQKQRLVALMERWIIHYLQSSKLDITPNDINLMEKPNMSLKKFVLKQREEGIKEGRQEGRQEGALEALKSAVLNLHRNMQWAADQIAAALQLPVEQVEQILANEN